MAIVVNDDTPEFLRRFLISQGVIEVKDTETGQTKVVPLPPRRRPVAEQDDGRTDDDFRGYQVASAASGFPLSTNSTNIENNQTPISLADTYFGEDPLGRSSFIEQQQDRDNRQTTSYSFDNLGPDGTLTINSALGSPRNEEPFGPGLFPVETESGALIAPYFNISELPSLEEVSVATEKPSNPLDKFTNFIGETTDKISKGLFGDINLMGQDRTGKGFIDRLSFGPGGRLKETFNDPYISGGQKAAEAIGMGVRGFMGMVNPFSTPLGLFSMMAHAAGAHHPFDVTKDADIFADPISGTMTWNTVDETAGGGGAQRGVLNMDNAIADIANQNPNQFINTPMGYITAGNLNNAIKTGVFENLNELSDDAFGKLGFTNETPFSFQEFGPNNVSNQYAFNEFSNFGTGAIQNEAGAIADRSGVGYNQQQDIANVISDFVNSGIDMDWDATDASDFSGVGDDGFAFDWGDDDWTL